jgi:hypothetical protein
MTTPLSADKIADLRAKHLELIQAIVARIANYGATLKNYCITLTTAACGFAITLHRPIVALLALLPIIVFGILDATFLRIERCFRGLFDAVRREDWTTPPSFEINLQVTPPVSYWDTLGSWSIAIFYVPLVAGVALVTLAASFWGASR